MDASQSPVCPRCGYRDGAHAECQRWVRVRTGSVWQCGVAGVRGGDEPPQRNRAARGPAGYEQRARSRPTLLPAAALVIDRHRLTVAAKVQPYGRRPAAAPQAARPLELLTESLQLEPGPAIKPAGRRLARLSILATVWPAGRHGRPTSHGAPCGGPGGRTFTRVDCPAGPDAPGPGRIISPAPM